MCEATCFDGCIQIGKAIVQNRYNLMGVIVTTRGK